MPEREVRLLPLGTNSTYIASGDVPWLIQWLADELEAGGICVEEGEPAPLAQNCAAPGVHIRWDFSGAWEAIALDNSFAVAGGAPATPQKAVRSFVDMLTPEKWDVVNKLHHYNSTLADATPDQRKKATFDYLEHHMMQRLATPGPTAQ